MHHERAMWQRSIKGLPETEKVPVSWRAELESYGHQPIGVPAWSFYRLPPQPLSACLGLGGEKR